MPIVDTNSLEPRDPKPGWHGRFFRSETMTFGYYEIDAGAALHEHVHENEEVWHVVAGQLALTIDGVEQVAGPGCAAMVPPNAPHAARAITDCRAIVVDQGIREEIGGVSTAAG
jgi:quercetin dioxygenase-like cupin family protein